MTPVIIRWLSGAIPPDTATEMVLNPGDSRKRGLAGVISKNAEVLNNASVIIPG